MHRNNEEMVQSNVEDAAIPEMNQPSVRVQTCASKQLVLFQAGVTALLFAQYLAEIEPKKLM